MPLPSIHLVLAQTAPVAPAAAQTPATPAAKRPLDIIAELAGIVQNNTLHAFIVAGGIVFATMAIFWLVRQVLLIRLRRASRKTTTSIDDLVVAVLSDIRFWCVLAVGITLGAQALNLPDGLSRLLRVAVVIIVGVQLLLTSRLVIDAVITRIIEKRRGSDGRPDPSLASGVGIIRFVSMLVLGVLLVLLVLANLGIEITPLLTGLGIGGIAIALAAQRILGDLFGSLTILFDKPFQVGDVIKVGEFVGSVEKIGVKTTRVRSVNGEMLVMTNTDLLESRLQNFQQMSERRVVGTLDLTYETSPAKLARVPALVQAIVESQQGTRFDRCHCRALASYSVQFEYAYFVCNADFMTHVRIQHAINLTLLETFAREQIEFAYPTSVQFYRNHAGEGSHLTQ
jgi:small-conductance mechanosensitive channel